MNLTHTSTQPRKPTVLVGFAEAKAAIETAWSLQEAGFNVAAFRRAGSKPALRRNRDVQLYEVPAPEEASRDTIASVHKLCETIQPSAVLPLDDQALWVCRQLDDPGICVASAQNSGIDIALDKSLQLKAAEEAGLPVPPSFPLEEFSREKLPDFPVMVKPALALYEVNGQVKRPSGVACANLDEFTRATAKQWPGKVLVQPLIQGTGEGLFGHVGTDGVVAWSSHRRVRMVNPQGSASSACQSQAVDESLLGPSERFLKAIGWQGLFMLEFLRDADGTPWFMELNGRTWGSMALARRRGFEYPAWTVQAALDPSFKPVLPSTAPEVRCRNIGLELVHLLFVVRGPQSSALVAWPPLGRTIREVFTFRRGDRLYNWNRSQPSVLLTDVWETLISYGRKMIHRRS